MELYDKDRQKSEFSARFLELLEDANVPPKGKGRIQILARTFQVSHVAVRKWLEGETYPGHHHMVEIVRWFNCQFEWLATGRGDKYSPSVEEDSGYQTLSWDEKEWLDLFRKLTPEQASLLQEFLRSMTSQTRKE